MNITNKDEELEGVSKDTNGDILFSKVIEFYLPRFEGVNDGPVFDLW